MERAYFIKDDSESLNTDNVVSDILNIERENTMKPNFNLKCNVDSNTIFSGKHILHFCSCIFW